MLDPDPDEINADPKPWRSGTILKLKTKITTGRTEGACFSFGKNAQEFRQFKN
jgi:hypothetical protein